MENEKERVEKVYTLWERILQLDSIFVLEKLLLSRSVDRG